MLRLHCIVFTLRPPCRQRKVTRVCLFADVPSSEGKRLLDTETQREESVITIGFPVEFKFVELCVRPILQLTLRYLSEII